MSRNVSGQAYALTVLTPVEHGREEALSAYLDALGDGDASPLARVPGTHLARWVVIGQVKHQKGQRRRDALKAPRLLFTSNFDGVARHVPGGPADRPGRRRRRDLGQLHRLPGPSGRSRLLRLDAPAPDRGGAVLRRLRRADRRRCARPTSPQRAAADRLRARGAQALDAAALKSRFLERSRHDHARPPNIQGFVVRGYRLPYAGYVFLRIDDAARARARSARCSRR